MYEVILHDYCWYTSDLSDIINYGLKKISGMVRRERVGGGGGGVILLHPRQHFFSHIRTEQMLSCYRPVLGNIFSVILGQSKCFLATDRYWVTYASIHILSIVIVLQISSLTRKCRSNFFSWLILAAYMLPLKNLTDATLASLSILRKTRWRPIWRLNIWAGHNKASIYTQGIFHVNIFDII